MNKFSDQEDALFSLDNKLASKPEYKKMLNNLLGITNRDNAIFTSSKVSNFDLFALLSKTDLKKIFTNKSFTVKIRNLYEDETITKLRHTQSYEDFITTAEANEVFVSMANRNTLKRSFEKTKQEVVMELLRKKNRKIAKWKRIRNKYLDRQALTNSWPLYVGTMFIKVKTFRSALYAPLILKKVSLEITNRNEVLIKTLDKSVDVNEKLLFLLQNNFQFNLPKIEEEKELSFREVIVEYHKALSRIIHMEETKIDFSQKFVTLNRSELKNEDLQYAPGIMLMLVSPSGGRLRDKLIQILNSSTDSEKILDVDTTINRKREVEEAILNKKGIYRITKTDLSQEKAIMGSLKGSSIIWGPPGTGKSQVIANVIANLLAEGKSALITSEKKAALDVIQNRLGKLSKFVLFGLLEKNASKKEFYKPFKELLKSLRSIDPDIIRNIQLDIEPKQFVPNNYFEFIKQNDSFQNEDSQAVAKTFKFWNKLDLHWSQKKIRKIHEVVTNNIELSNQIASGLSIEKALENNGVSKSGLIFKRFPKKIRIFIKIVNKINNLDFLKSLSKVKNIQNVLAFNEKLIIENKYANFNSRFESDEDYLEKLLSRQFIYKIYNLRRNPEFKKRINSFLRNCDSGFRLPHKFINIHRNVLMELFKIFVSTPQSLANSINMNQKYDYSIFDEASQLHLEKAFPYLHLSNINVIAGDDQQMRPTSFFELRDKTNVIEETEENAQSLLDYAFRKGLSPSRRFMLTKNYRSKKAELMMFSSKEFYNNNLDVIDEYNFSNKCPITVIDVNGKWEQRINEKEAILALDQVLRKQKAYPEIILLTLNSTQKQHIEGMVYAQAKYSKIIEMLEKGTLKLRNLENIQGDEADLVVVSVAYDRTASLGATYVARPEGRNALNVAISRARAKIIVLKSITSNEVEPKKENESILTFKRWLHFLEITSQERHYEFVKNKPTANEKIEKFESTFEEVVFLHLKNKLQTKKKIFLTTQYPIGSYRIDIVAIDQETNQFVLGIEVDGYRYHSNFQAKTKDLERQMFLEAKGYPIYRITELRWNNDPNKESTRIGILVDHNLSKEITV